MLTFSAINPSVAFSMSFSRGMERKFPGIGIRPQSCLVKGKPTSNKDNPSSTQLSMRSLESMTQQPAYIEFKDVSGKQDVLLKFAADLDIAAERNDGMRRFFTALTPTFAKLISPNSQIKNDLSEKLKSSIGKQTTDALKFSVAHNKQLDTYMFTFNGWSDSLMRKYAKTYQFPRGCPVLWKPGHFIDIRGFYPKFDNDEITETGFNTQVLEGASSIEFFLKWSGFLIQLFAFEIEGRYYWSVLSKSKADTQNPFVQLGRKLIEPKMTLDLAKELADNHLYLGAEGLSPEDDMHGYIARMNAAIVTCIGQGTYANLISKKNLCFENTIVQYRKHNEITDFCRKYELSCDNAVSICGDYDVLATFTKLIFARRDFMKLQDFERTFEGFKCQYPAACMVSSGTISHETVAGNNLEGMVFSIMEAGGKQTTEKVKLPYYTWRTMFLRTWLGADDFKDGESHPLANMQFVTAKSLGKMVSFAERWCTSPEGKAHFMKMMKAAAFTLQCNGKVSVNGEMCTTITKNLHVHLADEIELLSPEALEEKAHAFDSMLRTSTPDYGSGPPIVCCFVLGPIGSGKTTFAERLRQETGNTVLHIDGDSVVDGRFTEVLGSERSDASKSALYKCILQGKHPILSTGGGVLDRFNVQQHVSRIFQRKVKVVLCIMKDVYRCKFDSGDMFGIKEITIEEMEQQLTDIYGTDDEYMNRVVEGRVKRNEWKKVKDNQFANINKFSQKNAAFASQLAKQADHIFTIPYDTSPEFRENPQNIIKNKVSGIEKISQIMKTPLSKTDELITGNFTQIRVVVSRNDSELERGMVCKHMTIQYDSGNLCTDFTAYDSMKQSICSKTPKFVADLYKITGKCLKYQDRKPVEIKLGVIRDCELVKNAHVTENCAQFKPELMKEVTKHIHDFEETTRKPINLKFVLPSFDSKSKSAVDFEFELANEIFPNNAGPKVEKSDIRAKFSELRLSYSKRQVVYSFVDLLLL
jgi:hypothetical protein